MWNRSMAIPAKLTLPLSEGWSLHRTLLVSSLLLTLFFSIIYLLNPKAIQILNLKSTDLILGASEAPEPDLPVVIVAIDEASLKKYGQWPWPRYRLARLLETIDNAGAASVGVSIIFPERDRTSPKIWQETLEKDLGYTIDTSGIPSKFLDYDTFLANIVESGPFVLGYELLFSHTETTGPDCNLNPVALSKTDHVISQAPGMNFYNAKGVVCNYKVLADAATRSGFLNGTSDVDGVLRRLPLMIEFDGNIYPSFALAVLMQYRQHDLLVLHDDNRQVASVSLQDLHIPTDNHGNFLLGPPQSQISEHLSAADVIEGAVAVESLEGKIVLVGLTASGLSQVYPTPMDPLTPLLDLHKYSIESVASSLHTIRTPVFSVYEVGFSFILCLFLAICIYYLPAILSVGLCLTVILLSWVLAATVFRESGYLYSPFLPTILVLLNCGLLIALKFRHFQLKAKNEVGETLLLLKSSETNLQSILNAIPDIVFRLDNSGKITFISPAISKYMKSPEHLLGRPIFDLVAPEDLDKAQYRINERRTGGRATHDLEIRLMLTKDFNTPQEGRRYFSVSAEGVYHDKVSASMVFIGTQGIVRDITERKRLEHQLLQAQKMEVVGNLAAGIAHDLNNILSGLVSYPDLLLLEIPKDSPLYEKVSVIQRSGKKAAVIVQDLLTLARRNVDITDVCNMNTIITEYLRSMEFQRVKDKYPEISIQTDLLEDLMNFKGSAVHLSKVIMNILHNALEAMPAGGVIKISTNNTYVESHLHGYEHIPEGEYICTIVSDNGVGIPHGDLERVFEPFYTKKSLDRSGTGLGMTVIWATVKDHDGYLDILSKEGQGTTLKIYLPVTREITDNNQGRIVLDDYIGTETILIVDDITEQLNIAGNMLSKLGYNVLTATSGLEAIATLKRQPVDVIILDMIMPDGLDGLETYEEVLKLNPQQKAIITSGFSESDRVKKLQQLGAGRYIQKPYTMEALGVAVRAELDK